MSVSQSQHIFSESPATLTEATFVERFGSVYEHSPWVAQRTWQSGLDERHRSIAVLAESMATVVARARREDQLRLIRTHPDLAGKAALKGELTEDSTDEQSSAGLDQCTAEELARFQRLNDAYKAKFDMPFIMAVRGSNRHQILAGFEERLANDPDTEFERALAEINRIALLRLQAIGPLSSTGTASEPAPSAQRSSTPASPAQRSSPPASPAQGSSPPASPAQTSRPTAAPAQKSSSTASSTPVASATAARPDLSDYPRDMIGYANHPPQAHWPDKARIALQFVINYEEGAENCILHGDPASEAFLSEIVGAQALPGVRHMNMESLYEYGSRVGFWRLHRVFSERNLPVTVFGVAMALERNPDAVAAMQSANWEIASHGYRWIDYQYMDERDEREHLRLAIEVHTRATGQRPVGWYLGRCSPNSHRLVAEEGGFIYNADSYADELPYWERRFSDTPQLIVPYTLDANDMRFASAQGFNAGDQFFNYLKDSFDVLYAEGAHTPRMMSIGLHCRLVGRPGRVASLVRFLDYVNTFDQVWIARRIEIAEHWRNYHPST